MNLRFGINSLLLNGKINEIAFSTNNSQDGLNLNFL